MEPEASTDAGSDVPQSSSIENDLFEPGTCNGSRPAPGEALQGMRGEERGVVGEKEFKQAKKAFKAGKSQAEKANLEKKRKALERALEQLDKLNTQVHKRGCVIPRQSNFTKPNC